MDQIVARLLSLVAATIIRMDLPPQITTKMKRAMVELWQNYPLEYFDTF